MLASPLLTTVPGLKIKVETLEVRLEETSCRWLTRKRGEVWQALLAKKGRGDPWSKEWASAAMAEEGMEEAHLAPRSLTRRCRRLPMIVARANCRHVWRRTARLASLVHGHQLLDALRVLLFRCLRGGKRAGRERRATTSGMKDRFARAAYCDPRGRLPQPAARDDAPPRRWRQAAAAHPPARTAFAVRWPRSSAPALPEAAVRSGRRSTLQRSH